MLFRHLSIVLTFFLISCGGSGSNDTSKVPPQPQATPPVVTLSIDSASVDESSVVVITHSAKDYQNATITSVLSCDVGILEGNNYTAPSVAAETTATCTVTATDSGNRSSTETLTLTINAVTPVLALANGATSATTAKLTAIDVSFADISEGLIDATLNGEEIKLAITPDKQLVYFPPMGATGTQTLEITIENEVVTYEYQAQDSGAAFGDAEVYVSDYLTKTKIQIDEIIQNKLASNALAEEIELLNSYKDSLSLSNEIFSSLTPNEIKYFAQIIFENNDFFESTSAPVAFSRKGTLNSQLSFKINPSLTECERKALVTGISATTTTALIAATAALAPSGVGSPIAVATAIGVGISALAWEESIADTYNTCIEPFKIAISGFVFGNQSLPSRISSPLISSKVTSVDLLAFFSNVEKGFTAQTQYQYLVGAEGVVTTIIGSYNNLAEKLNSLFDLVGRDNVPDYAENVFSTNLNANDILFKNINPINLNVSAITDSGVSGRITDRNENNLFDMTFKIEDLEVPHIPFQFTITDSGHETPFSSVIDAEVTLNPPIAYDTTFAAVIGEEMVARLQADFETGFIIKEQPKFGTLDTSLDSFSMPGGGLFGYTPDENITEDTTDTFTFVATNGSTTNGGESNEATITIEITANPYTISVANYRPSYKDGVSEQQSIAPNQSVTFYNSVTKLIGAKLQGQSVVIKNTYNGDYNYWGYVLPQAEFGPKDVVIGTYNFTLQDITNNRAISVPVELTMSNEAYRRIVGTTLTIHGYGFDNANVHFKEDFTYTINGEQRGSYSFAPEIYDSYVTCADSVIDNVNVGAIQTNGRSGAYGELPGYIMIHEDGTYSSNSFYGCPERLDYKRIF